MRAPTSHSSISSSNLVCSCWWPSEDDASKEAQRGPEWDRVGSAAGALSPQPHGMAVTSKGVKVISEHLRPQEKQGFGRWVSWYFQAEAAATNLQAVGIALQCLLPAWTRLECCVQTPERELAPLCQTRWLLNTALSNMQAHAEPSLSPPAFPECWGSSGMQGCEQRERETEITLLLCQ